MKSRKKTRGLEGKRDTGRHGRDWSYEGDRGLGEVPARAQRSLTHGPGGASDRSIRQPRKVRPKK